MKSLLCLKSNLVDVSVDGVPFRLYAQRYRHPAELLAFADHWADREHLVQSDRVVTFGQFRRSVERLAGQLAGSGIGCGSRVMIHAWNSPDWILWMWAIWRAGAVPVLGNSQWSAEEIDHALAVVKPELVAVSRDLAHYLPATTTYAVIDRALTSTPVSTADLDRRCASIAEGDPGLILFTSGTTHFAKAVELPCRSVILNLQGFLNLTGRVDKDDPPQATALVSSPLFHIGGPLQFARALVQGERRVFPTGRFDAGETLELTERYRVRSLQGVPTMLARILDHPDFLTRDLSSVQTVTYGASAVPKVLFDRLCERLPQLTQSTNTGYGLTEAGGALTAARARDAQSRPGTVARLVPWADLRILDPDDSGEGEIAIRCGGQMLRYVGEEFGVSPDGWIRTGDLGRVDADRFVWITGRLKDIIIRGGENIAPARIEAILAEHPAVQEVAVFGIPDDEFGEIVATVVRTSATEDDLREFARTRLSRFEMPALWHFTDSELPTTANGKVLTRALRDLVADADRQERRV